MLDPLFVMFEDPQEGHQICPKSRELVPAAALIAAASLATYNMPPARPTYSGLKCCVSTKRRRRAWGRLL